MITFTRCAFMAKQACATCSKVVQKITPPIANNFLKFFFVLFAMLTLNAATAWAEDYSIKFLTNTSDGSNEITSSTRTVTVLESASCSNVSGFTNNCTKAYYKGKSGVKLSSGSASGTLEFTLSDVCNKNVSKVVFKTAKYNSELSTLTFYAGTSKLGTVDAGNEFSYTFTEPQSISTLKISSTKRAYVSEITISVNSAVTPESGTAKTATYTVSSATAVTATGNIPQGSTATLSGTGSLNGGFIQCTNGKNHTLTLTGYEGYKITGVTIHVKSNSSKGTGSFSVVAGSKTIANVVESAFNSTNWNGSWNNSGVDKVLTMTDNSYEIKTGENVKLTINCKSGSSDYNSLYIKSYTITYEPVSSTSEPENPTANYTIKHYLQNILDDNYTLKDTKTLSGEVGTEVTPSVESYEGFTAPSTQTVTIASDGSTVVEYKYTRNSYKLTWDLDGGTITTVGTTAGSVKYGATIIAPTVTKDGCQFKNWNPSVPATMPADDATYTAQWSKLYTVTLSENGTTTEPTTQTSTTYKLPAELTAGSCQDDTKELVGWSTVAIPNPGDMPTSKFYELGETVTLSEDKTTFYAVFATPTTIPGGTEEKEVVTALDFSNQGYENGEEVTSLTIDDVTVAFNKGTNSNVPKYYNTGTAVRVYGGGYFTVSSKNITKIAITTSTGEDSNAISADCGTYDTNNKTWTGSAQSVQFTVGGTTGHRRIKSVEVTYTTTVQADDIVTYSNYSTKCVPTCKITYNFDGGEGECTTAIVEEGSEYTLCATVPAKAGHEFLNWKDQYGTEYEAGDKITSVTEDLTLTAQWQVNSYEVTWMSLGSKLSSSDVNYNTQPTQPTTNLTYLCGTDKEFVGWTTQEIDGVGTPANLYTNDFPVVTANVTYHAVFATKSEDGGSLAKATSLTNGEFVYLATESGIGVMGANTETNKDAAVSTTQSDWMAFTVVANDEQYQFKNGDNYITAGAKTFKITTTPSDFAFENGYIVYNVPSGSDAGDYVLLYNSNNGSFYRFYKISNMGKENYETFYIYKSNPTHTDYVTSCEEVGSDMSNSTLVNPSVESGIFSVGNGKYVQFSTGNLQYEVGTNTWSFASEQYEVIGGDPYTGSNNTNYGMNVPGYTGKLDLFAWSSDGKFGVNPSNTDDDYGYAATDFVDWGTLVNESGWYTLTEDEMKHILARTKNGKTLWALATVNGLNGLILLPDNWNTSISLVYGYVPTQFVYTENQLAISQWEALEAEGAVFLPAGGSRTGGYGNEETAGGKGSIDANGDYFHVDNVGDYGYYWLNTQDTRPAYPHCASFLMLPGWDEGPTVDEEGLDDLSTPPVIWSREKRRGNSVRLVKKVTPDYTRDNQGAGVYGTVCYPENIVWCDGGTLYEVAGKEGNKVIFDEVTTPVAGMPYIFIADQEVLNFFCGTEYEGTAGEYNSLKGTFETIQPAEDNILVGNYMLVNNIIKKCGINCGLYANRAYFVATDLESMGTAPAAAPGRRRISLDVTSENTTTSLDNITNGDNTTIKVIENSQLIIIRNGEKFNAQGQKL